ncbi:carboxymuconolactone decarboxylase family protein [Paenibacillus polysaccharolyticus]|uniref:Carboxymuconolactone decarboxylase family protein n=1 Tax=Paenibacillus cucumis (ex Kampfer et al. 2016) TaxID=1776858 RepID=A0ABS7KC67_9BACL|nr:MULTISPECIES: carboxymuconolactone decarboxylase family protein [Paenibacillus]MBY0201724.1 carboxymuconolactone decarboxylase family protein [Paenibacillus cucumis (ex Kampfer et al. 2016)]MCP1134956.1 carboxymuconolactone decarboxylase family protein [Paenibacillus polysaccharolyticus]
MSDQVTQGLDRFAKLSGEYGAKALAPIKEHFPELSEFIMGTAYGDIFQRTTITDQWKEVAIISSLITQGQFEQLGVHYAMALSVGITVDELKGVLLHLAPCVGAPRIISAFNVLLATLEEIQ